MPTFLSDVVVDILQKEIPISDYTFILPSKRAGNFLKKELKNKLNQAALFPEIKSIEDFIYELSSIQLIDTTPLLFEFYSIYLANTPKDSQESFDAFSKWATVALQDFNEIDRHLVDATYIFNYLHDINRIEKWDIEKGSETPLIEKHFIFFKRLKIYYNKLYQHLLLQNRGYQGIQYREAFENLQNYIENNQNKKLVFAGFNALNKAEESIIKELLENQLAHIYWDADAYYFNEYPASIFLREYKNGWNYYKNHPFNWIKNNLNQKKNIRIIGAPKNSSQIKYVGELLSSLKASQKTYENTALVLADESLLPMMLSSLPRSVDTVNITMGYELSSMSVSNLIEIILKFHVNAKNDGQQFYYKQLIQLLNHPNINGIVDTKNLIDHILKNNYIYLNINSIKKICEKLNLELGQLEFLFENWKNSAARALENLIQLLKLLKNNTQNILEKEFLFKNLTILQKLKQLNTETGFLKDIKTLHQFYRQLIKTEKLSFQGEPLSGLQLMGMLETRVLDFETVILTSTNEGILPSGKSDSSFIPFDVKKEVGLPTYQERDAIFSYHFYRLIQRAKNVYLLYNTENDHYGSGEQSRFITELEINKTEDIEKKVVSSRVTSQKIALKQIAKSQTIIDRLNELAYKGLSPTSLTNYINNPIGFYQQKILGIKEVEEAEETIAANTLGTIIHKALEAFYNPYIGIFLKKEHILSMKKQIENEVKKWFVEIYKNGDISSGKNLLIYNIAKQFISNFLDQELRLLNQGKQLKILALEYDLETEIKIDGLQQPVKLIGLADRIDELDRTIRIIDYKTGKVEQKDLTIKDWNLITADYKYSKSLQVLLYALMYGKMKNINFDLQPVESGTVSFKNLNSGFLKVNKKFISREDIVNFTNELKHLIAEIFNQDIPFVENENKYF